MKTGPFHPASCFRWLQKARNKAFTVLVSGGFRKFGARSTLCLPVRLGGERGIEIGARVFVGAGCWIESLAEDGAANPVIVIGDGTSFSGNATVTAVRKVWIGNHVLIARNVHISDHFHAFTDPLVPVKDQGVDRIADVVIHDGAWIGHGAVICPGVTIGRNAVVGANSVVREDVPDHCVAAGVPARIIRRQESQPLQQA